VVVVARDAIGRRRGGAHAFRIARAYMTEGDAFRAGGADRRFRRVTEAVRAVAHPDLAPDGEHRAILGRAAPALAGLACLIHPAEVTGEHAAQVVLLRIGFRVALPCGRIAAHLVALGER